MKDKPVAPEDLQRIGESVKRELGMNPGLIFFAIFLGGLAFWAFIILLIRKLVG